MSRPDVPIEFRVLLISAEWPIIVHGAKKLIALIVRSRPADGPIVHRLVSVYVCVYVCAYVYLYEYECIFKNNTHDHETHYHHITTPDTNNADRDLESVSSKSASVRIRKMVNFS